MRISDWSSDVCSSDLAFIIRVIATSTTPAAAALTWNCGSGREIQLNIWIGITVNGDDSQSKLMNGGATVTIGGGRKAINVHAQMVMIGAVSPMARDSQIGRASCRERVCQYV